MMIFNTGWSDLVDGPGRRLVWYLKECNFRCRWCANPEGLESIPSVAFYPDRVRQEDISCVCPHGAITGRTLNRSICVGCADRACVNVWKTRVMEFPGQQVGVEEVVARCARERDFMGASGGVTFGGGEPSLQHDELVEAAGKLTAHGIHTALETNCSTPAALELADVFDMMICDFKCFSSNLHRDWTGADNDMVKRNLLSLAADCPVELVIRLTLVQGFNTDSEELELIREFLLELNGIRENLKVDILRMHHAAEPKYRALGIDYSMSGVPVPSVESAREVERMFNASGLVARCPM